MFLPTLTHYWPSGHAHKSLSTLGAGVAILAASFLSHFVFRHFEPRSTPSYIVLLIVTPALLSIPVSCTGVSPYAAVLLAFTAYIGALLFFILAYRLSPFHPLAKYPGPVIAKTSKWWTAYISARGDLHRYYKSLHDRYGDVVRIGPNELSICDASLIRPILGQGGLPKGPRWEGRPGNPSLLAQRDPVKHMHQRKPWNRAFASTALPEYEVIVANRTRQLLSCLENLVHGSAHKDGVLLDIVAWLNYFTTDFMGDMAFGGGFELMKAGGDEEGIWTLLHAGLRINAIMAHVTYALPFLWAFTGKNGTIQRNRAFTKENVLKRLALGASRKDLFYYLSGEELPESERPSIRDVARDGSVAVIAGSDTTSSVLAAIFYYLLLNPYAYTHLQKEVDSAFSIGEEPLDLLKLSQMEWLNGCINEGLRLQPPVPSGSQRSVNKGTGAKVLGKLVVPEQTQLTLHTYSIQRDVRYFHKPDAFLPERWFVSRGATDAHWQGGEHNVAAFIPFSYGPTNCVGKTLALMQMRMVLCWMLLRFRFSRAPGVDYEAWEGHIQDWYVVHHGPLMVNVSLRNDS